jgi:iron complex transport system substrate-binding protein
VLSFSDLQADIVAALIRQGIAVHAFNQRTIAGIFDMIRMLGAMVGAAERADRLADELDTDIADARQRAAVLPERPRVYFEEWDEPMISGIAWVSELIEIAGGADIFADRAVGKSAKERIVTAEAVIPAGPTSSSARGAARSSTPSGSLPDPGSRRYRRCEMARSMRSSRRSSCSRDRPP